MPRRPPPSPLRLSAGPTPPRNQPKHTLPSLPRATHWTDDQAPRITSFNDLPPLMIPSARPSGHRTSSSIGGYSPVTSGSTTGYSPMHGNGSGSWSGSTSSVNLSLGFSSSSSPPPVKAKMRGPWDHSGTIALPFDVMSILAPLKPVAAW